MKNTVFLNILLKQNIFCKRYKFVVKKHYFINLQKTGLKFEGSFHPFNIDDCRLKKIFFWKLYVTLSLDKSCYIVTIFQILHKTDF